MEIRTNSISGCYRPKRWVMIWTAQSYGAHHITELVIVKGKSSSYMLDTNVTWCKTAHLWRSRTAMSYFEWFTPIVPASFHIRFLRNIHKKRWIERPLHFFLRLTCCFLGQSSHIQWLLIAVACGARYFFTLYLHFVLPLHYGVHWVEVAAC